MVWTKTGMIYAHQAMEPWGKTHAQIPTVDLLEDDRLRIYYGTRDAQHRTSTTYVEVDAGDPTRLLYVHDEPILPMGKPGCFDDCGVMPSWVVRHDEATYLYYIGWNVAQESRYRVAIGLARSLDGGRSFQRHGNGPVLDRGPGDPCSVTTPCVWVENGYWRMWYSSFDRWETIRGRAEPFYHIRYAESHDGVRWCPADGVCVGLHGQEGGLARPSVIRNRGLYRMWYSVRMSSGYRETVGRGYRIGYAQSQDGRHWQRQDDQAGLERSDSGWDSAMTAYPCVYRHAGRLHMVYNGNRFGRDGFGHATWNQETSP